MKPIKKILRLPSFVSYAFGGLRLTAKKAEDMETVIEIVFTLVGDAPKGKLFAYVDELVDNWLKDAGAIPPLAWESTNYEFDVDYTVRGYPRHRITYQLSILSKHHRQALLNVIAKVEGVSE